MFPLQLECCQHNNTETWGLNRHMDDVSSSLTLGIGVLRKALDFYLLQGRCSKKTLAICQALDFGPPDLPNYERRNACLL